jgi:hypothetical protein
VITASPFRPEGHRLRLERHSKKSILQQKITWRDR